MRHYILILFLLFSLMTCVLSNNIPSGFEYISPQPGSEHVSRFSSIIFRFAEFNPIECENLSSCIHLTGSKGGSMIATIKIAADGETVLCKPDVAFIPGEAVTLVIKPFFQRSTQNSSFSAQFRFFVSNEEREDEQLYPSEKSLDKPATTSATFISRTADRSYIRSSWTSPACCCCKGRIMCLNLMHGQMRRE